MGIFSYFTLICAGWAIAVATIADQNHDYAPDLQNIPGLAFTVPVIQSSSQFSGQRQGSPTNDHMCDQVTSVPRHLTFITKYYFYQKYTHAYGIPIVSSLYVSDAALKRACYVLRFLLADLYKVRYYLYKNFGRAGIIGANEGVRSIPEHSYLPSWWDQRARGLGGVLGNAISTGGEENLLCWSNDKYRNEDIFLHEFSHGIQEVAITAGAIPGFNYRLQSAYNYARSRGLWANTYAMSTWKEYFAEGVQSYFQVNDYAHPPNGIHNSINTREKLRRYDPTLYALVKEVFPCGNILKDRCDRSGTIIPFKMDCDGTGAGSTVGPSTTITTVVVTKKPGTGTTIGTSNATAATTATAAITTTTATTTKATTTTSEPTVCVDKNPYCASWAANGECSRNPVYMHANCPKSCGKCGGGGSCSDSHQYCPSWAAAGHCRINPGWMLQNCKKSCQVC